MKTINIYSRYPNEVRKALAEISKTENCFRSIKKAQDVYLADKEEEYVITVNDSIFAIYSKKEDAKSEFNNIKTAIGNNNRIYELK